MADVQYAGRLHDELPLHEQQFHRFIQLVYVGVFHVANFLVALEIGGVEGHWGTTVLIMILATGAANYCLIRTVRAPMATCYCFHYSRSFCTFSAGSKVRWPIAALRTAVACGIVVDSSRVRRPYGSCVLPSPLNRRPFADRDSLGRRASLLDGQFMEVLKEPMVYFAVPRLRLAEQGVRSSATWRHAVELARRMRSRNVHAIAPLRTEAASRVERAGMLLMYRERHSLLCGGTATWRPSPSGPTLPSSGRSPMAAYGAGRMGHDRRERGIAGGYGVAQVEAVGMPSPGATARSQQTYLRRA